MATEGTTAAPTTVDGGPDIGHVDLSGLAPQEGSMPRGWSQPKGGDAAQHTGVTPPQPSRAQQVATAGAEGKAAPRAKGPAQRSPQAPPAATKPEAAPTKRDPVMAKVKLDDGSEVEVDVSEQVQAALASTKRRVKANGQERELTVDELAALAPLAEHARAKAHDADRASKALQAEQQQSAQLVAMLKDKRRALEVLEHTLGSDVLRDVMETRLAEQFRREDMKPEERAALEQQERAAREYDSRERTLAERERAFAEAQKAATEARVAAKAAELTERYQREFPLHLKAAGLPTTPRLLARLADAIAERDASRLPIDDAQVARDLAAEVREEALHFVNGLEPDAVLGALPDAAKRLREADTRRLDAVPGARAQVATERRPAQQPPQAPRSYKELREQNAARDREAQRQWERRRGA